jgi:hypothetical protein
VDVAAIWSRNALGPSVGSAAVQKGTAAEWKGTMQHCMISESLVVFVCLFSVNPQKCLWPSRHAICRLRAPYHAHPDHIAICIH